MSILKDRFRLFSIIVLSIYILIVFCITLLIREPLGKVYIQTEWLRGVGSPNPNIYKDNLFNLLLFVPIGVWVGLVSIKYKLFNSFLIGLFISETIECSQLIWQLGSFDVDDLFFNVLGAFLGGLLVVLVVWIKRLKKKSIPSG